MKTSIIIAVIIAFLLVGGFLAWRGTGKKISLPGKTFQNQLNLTTTPTSTPTATPTLPPSRTLPAGGIEKTPTTGVNLLLPLMASAALGASGWYLLKKK